MLLCVGSKGRALQSNVRNVEGDDALPHCEQDPFPEDTVVEVLVLLACVVEHRVFVGVICTDVLLKACREEAGPGGKESVVEQRQPVEEEDLAGETVVYRKVNLAKCQRNVFVEVVAYHPCDSSVTPATVYE